MIDNKKDIALICGSGAVDNSWNPIFRAIKPTHFKSDFTKEGANTALALLVYNLRFHTGKNYDLNDSVLIKCKTILENTRNAICEHIKFSQQTKELKVHSEFQEIVSNIILPLCNRLLLISTNWDTVIDDAICTIPAFKNIKCLHIHGTYKDSTTLYLPTEICSEKYRTQPEEFTLGRQHGAAMTALKNAQVIILYGLSISPLDAELLQIIGSGMDSNILENIKIIDLYPEVVAEKINVLLGHSTTIKIEGYTPLNINTPVEYLL
ncbi:MAG: hypothetical protein ABI208_04015 [Ginsengibacter sp.]